MPRRNDNLPTLHAVRRGAANLICVAVLVTSSAATAGDAPMYPDRTDPGYYLNDAGVRTPVKSVDDWKIRREHILANVEKVMGPLPDDLQAVPLDVQTVSEETVDGVIRRKISYHTDSPDRRIRAWLYIPTSARKPVPGVLCLHQTTGIGKDEPAGLGGKPNLHYAAELAREGFVTLSPDYPSFGEHEYDFAPEHGYVSGSMKAIVDNHRAVDVLCSLDEVDAEQIGCIGHSLGGHNSIFTAVFDTRIKAVVSCCGFTRFHKYYGGKLKGWTSSRYMPRIATEYGNDPDRVPFDFPELIAAIAPRAFLAVAPERDSNFEVSGVRDTMDAARPIYQLFDAADKLQAVYPDAAHDFPPDDRRTAYDFLKANLTASP